MEVAKLVEETLNSLVSKIELLQAKLTQVEQEKDDAREGLAARVHRNLNTDIDELMARAEAAEQDRNRLAAEVERLHVEHAELFHDLQAALTAAQEENKRLEREYMRKCQDMVDRAYTGLRADLTAAQQSAQEQYKAGIEKAIEILVKSFGGGSLTYHYGKYITALTAMRELSKGEGK